MYAKFHQNILYGSRDRASFIFFRIWTLAKPQPMTNGICQSLQLVRVNINVCAKFYQNIPYGPVVMEFSLFQNLGLGTASTNGKWYFAIPWVISMCMGNFIQMFHTVQEIWPVSLFQNLDLSKDLTDDKWHYDIPLARSYQYRCVCKFSSKYSSWFKFWAIFAKFADEHTTQTARGWTHKLIMGR